jgi:integration host factor subunit beta
MNRTDLEEAILAENPGLAREQAKALISAFFATIAKHIADGGRVEMRRFGSFTTRERAQHVGRNPRTGAAVQVTAKRLPHFAPARNLREVVAKTRV